MERLPPIPTPPSQLWREIRIRFLPVLLFVAAAATAALLWKQNVAATSLVGEVEVVRASVSSPKSGRLALLNVHRLQRVRAGDQIAQVVTTEPEVIQSSLAVIQSEIQLLRVNLEPFMGQQRFAVSFDRLRLDWMAERVQLATARVRLQLADTELRRTQELFNQKVISEQLLDTALTAKRSLEAEINERAALVEAQERKLHSEDASHSTQQSDPEEVLRASVKVQEDKLRLTETELSPVTLTVPMDGVVTSIHHRSGEAILAGAPIVTLTAPNSDRIIGYVRQPLPFQPRVGMPVEVRTRSASRCISRAEIMEVGAGMEPISPVLAAPAMSHNLQEVGLQVLVSLPPSHKLMPGELVDLRIFPEGKVHAVPLSTELH
jgi:multidrug resistance efflux pump